MVRELDLKKPPSIAESIDWARALLLLGVEDIDERDVHRDDVRDRQAPHRHGRGRRARRAEAPIARRCRLRSGRRGTRRQGLPARILELGEELRREGVAVGTSELLDAFEVLREISWTSQERLPRGARRDARQEPGGPARVRARVRPLLLPRRRARRRRARACSEEDRATLDELSDEELDALRAQIAEALRDGAEGAMRDLARMAIAAFARRQEGSGVIGVDVQRIRRALGLRAEPQPRAAGGRPAPRRACRATRCAASRRSCAASSSARRSSAPATLPPARPLRRSRPRAALRPAGRPRGRAPRGRAAAPAAGHAGPAGARAPPPRPRRRAPHDARVAADRRRAGRAQVPPAPPAPPGDLRAVRRLHERHLGVGVLPVGAARAARHVPQDALVRVHRAHLRGDRHLRARAQLQDGERTHRQRRRRRRHLRLHRLRARVVGVPRAGRGRSAPARDA